MKKVINLIRQYSPDVLLFLHFIFMLLIQKNVLQNISQDVVLFSFILLYVILIHAQYKYEQYSFKLIKKNIIRLIVFSIVYGSIALLFLRENRTVQFYIYLMSPFLLIVYFMFNILSNKIYGKNIFMSSFSLVRLGSENMSPLDVFYAFFHIVIVILYFIIILMPKANYW